MLAFGLTLSGVVVAGHARSADLQPLTRAEVDAIAARVGPSIVLVEAQTCHGGMTGSGFLTGGRLVTSRHLVAGAAELILSGGVDGARRRVAVAGVLDPADLALSAPLAGPGRPFGEGLEVASGPPADGTPVVIAARARGGLRWLAAVARTVDGAAYGAGGPLLLLDRPVAPGWSGGPVVDRSGHVVGVVRAVDGATAVTLAEPVAELGSRASPVWSQDDNSRDQWTTCKSDHVTG